MLAPQKVTDLLDLVVISGKALFSTKASPEGHLFPLERQNDRSFLRFDVDEAKAWKAKKSRDKPIKHLVGPPCCHLAMSTRKNYTSSDAFFGPHFLVKNRITQVKLLFLP